MHVAGTARESTAASVGDRFREGGARSEPVNFSQLTRLCVDMFSAAAEARQINLESTIEPEIEVMGFAHHLRQVLNNLLDNALKFTPSGGNVHVALYRELTSAAVLRVRDTGCGIRSTDLPHIFEVAFSAATNRGNGSRAPPARVLA